MGETKLTFEGRRKVAQILEPHFHVHVQWFLPFVFNKPLGLCQFAFHYPLGLYLLGQGVHKTFQNPSKPLIAITTNAGTGSEVDMFSVISNDELEEKTGVFDISMFPTISVVDSNLMISVPQKFTAYQGMDAFFHAAESVINKNEHPMGVENPQSGKYFINALDQLLASINCDDLKMSDYTS